MACEKHDSSITAHQAFHHMAPRSRAAQRRLAETGEFRCVSFFKGRIMKANGFRLDLLSAMNPEASESADLGQGGGNPPAPSPRASRFQRNKQ